MKNWDVMIEENEMGTQAKKNNKGFSLVELIIVIAIMAILVGVVGTQVLPYMEKSREAKDMQVVSAICTAAATSFAENAGDLTTDVTLTYLDNTAVSVDVVGANVANIDKSLKELLGVPAASNIFDSYLCDAVADTKATALDSRAGKTATNFTIVYDYETGNITVRLYSGTAAAGTALLDPAVSK